MLIELLAVVAIVSILAAIALPSYLDAEAGTKVAKALSRHRTVMGAADLHCMDTGDYPLVYYGPR